MAETGVHVKALDALPELLEVDVFYWEMFNLCGSEIGRIIEYCSLYDQSKQEMLDAIEILQTISNGVK